MVHNSAFWQAGLGSESRLFFLPRFDFSDPTKNVREKEMKRLTLLELVDYVNSGTGKFNEAVFEDITQMLVANLFRTLPPSSHENSANVDNFDPEEEEPSMEPAWPHLQIVSTEFGVLHFCFSQRSLCRTVILQMKGCVSCYGVVVRSCRGTDFCSFRFRWKVCAASRPGRR